MSTAISVYSAAASPAVLEGTVQPDIVDGFSSTRTSQTIVTELPVVGNSVFVDDILMRPMTRRTGTITALFASRADAFYLERAASLGGRVLFLSDSDVADVNMWFIVDGSLTIDQADDNRSVWIVTLDYRQINAPAGV